MREQEKAHITIFQAPYASLMEHGLYMKMHDLEPFQGVVPAEYYLPVFSGTVDCPENLPEDKEERAYGILECVFSIFNTKHPSGYCGRSLSVGDIVLLEGQHYLCATIGFQPIGFQTSENSLLPEKGKGCEVKLPGGVTLRAAAYQGTEYPCINIMMCSPEGEEEAICFAEHNPEREDGHQLCIGVYCDEEEDTVYYDSYCR